MKRVFTVFLLIATTGILWGQASPRTTSRRSRSSVPGAQPAVTAEDLKALRDALAAQQQQIEELRQELRQRDEQFRAAQQRLEQATTAATEAQTKAAAAQSAAEEQKEGYAKLQSDVKDIQGNMTTSALQTQEEQKRASALEGLLGRFRFNGDIRVRQEDFFQSYDGCPNNGASCNPRIRERIRLRFGVEGRLNEDFVGGIYVASGILADPTSTNETLTNNFEKKTIGFDRGYIIYNPHRAKWLALTGGKFAATWIKTNQTFDPDINPEGFTEKLSFDLKSSPLLKNVTFQGIQLLYNEANRPASASSCAPGSVACLNSGTVTGGDSYAAGGQVSAKLQLARRWTLVPAYTLLNWKNNDVILNESATVTGGSAGTFAPNGMTNATVNLVNGTTTIRSFYSKFLYSDLILDNTFDTGWKKFPFRLVLEYLDNLNAQDHPLLSNGTVATDLGRQSHLYRIEGSLGQTKSKGDFQLLYSFHRQEQDSVIASFAESDQRAPTNVVQHMFVGAYKVRNNTTLQGTLWVGRTLNSALQNSSLASGITAGTKERYLKRMQFDVVYSF